MSLRFSPSQDRAIDTKLENLGLPDNYRDTVERWLAPISDQIQCLIAPQGAPKERKTIIIGVQGSQGSGKSTASALLELLLQTQFGLNCISLSLDDFYLTRSERQHLADTVHPLLKTRGVPGTHDVALALQTIHQLSHLKAHESCEVVRFNKGTDDRHTPEHWDTITGPVDIIILEGWCVGLSAEPESQLISPSNKLEAEEDADGRWRSFVNQQLAGDYQTLFGLLDKLLVLKAPSFHCVYHWRLRQEQKLIASLAEAERSNSGGSEGKLRTQSPKDIERFIAHYQRLTQWALDGLPQQADWCLHLSEEQQVTHHSGKSPLKPLHPKWLVATDLDGTLLDHHNYSFEAALPALDQLTALNIPVLINTSKTAQEVLALQQQLALRQAFIVENGSALHIPIELLSPRLMQSDSPPEPCGDGWSRVVFGKTLEHIIAIVHQAREKHHWAFEGYSDWTVEDVIQHTGLNHEQATQSKARQYSEPLIWQDSEDNLQQFIALMHSQGLQTLRGGRFLHVLGQTNKAKPLQFFQQMFYGEPKPQLICLGDSPNDIEMLAVADVPVWCKSPIKDYPSEKDNPAAKAIKNPILTQGFGPVGWHQAIETILTTAEVKLPHSEQ